MARRSADPDSSSANGKSGTIGLRRSDRFLSGLRTANRVVFVSHVQPDPDSLGSMLGLAHLVETRLGKPTVITRDGLISRAENRAMVEVLHLDLIPVEDVVWEPGDAVVMVDSQPKTGRHTFAESVRLYAVIDHHDTPGDLDGVPFTDIRASHGATCTVVAKYLREQGVAIPEKVATALLYGIETEVTGYPREASQADDAALIELYPIADKDLIAQIRNARLPHSHFECLLQALQSSFIYDRLIISWVDELPQPEQAAEVVDFMIRFEQVDWAVCGGVYKDQLILSVRAAIADARAGDVLRQVVGRLGKAGGHDRRAGGAIRLASTAPTAIEELQSELRRRFVKALRIEDVRGQRLVPLREMLQNLQSCAGVCREPQASATLSPPGRGWPRSGRVRGTSYPDSGGAPHPRPLSPAGRGEKDGEPPARGETRGLPMNNPVPPPPSAPVPAAVPVQPPAPPPAARPRRPFGCLLPITLLVLALSLLANVILGVAVIVSGAGSFESDEPTSLRERFYLGDKDARDKVAVVRLDGLISDFTIGYPVKQLEKAAKDRRVKAVVLRIDSPGGTVTASEELYQTVLSVRDGTDRRFKPTGPRPVAVSMGSLAASGGYYVASAGSPISAEVTTITGSIGVFAMLPNVAELAHNNGVRFELVKAGAVKGSGSFFHTLSPEERQTWQDTVDNAYDVFLARIAAGRPRLTRDRLRSEVVIDRTITVRDEKGNPVTVLGLTVPARYTRVRADGGTFTSDEALKFGLIDKVDDLPAVIRAAAAAAGLGSFKAVVYDRPAGLLDLVLGRQVRLPASGPDLRDLSSALTPRLWYLTPSAEGGILSAGH